MILVLKGPKPLLRVNTPFTTLFGHDAGDLQTRPLLDWIHTEDRDHLEQVIDSGGCVSARVQTQDGEWVKLDWSVRPDSDNNTAILGLLTNDTPTLQSATAPPKGKYSSKILETLDAMARVVESNNPGLRCSILLVDKDRKYITSGAGPSLSAEYNSAVEGLHIGPVVGSCGTASFWNVPVVVENIAEDPLWRDLRGVAKQTDVAACWSMPVTATTGEVVGALALYSHEPSTPTLSQMHGLGITARMVALAIERDALEVELREAAQRENEELARSLHSAEKANRLKSEFLANMSHELRTPLTAIIGFAEELLASEAIAAEQLAMVGPIRRNGEYLLDLINDLLDLSKIEAGELAPELAPFSPADLLRGVHETLALTARDKGVGFELHVGPVPIQLTSDARKVGQIILNLVGNALKFTSEGTVAIRASIDAQRSAFRVRVEDTGPGIGLEHLETVFDAFRQADGSSTRRHGGTGLGLAISRELARSLGGDLSVESRPGTGSTFELILPLQDAEVATLGKEFAVTEDSGSQAETPPQKDADLNGVRILFVEDCVDNQRLIHAILTKCGAHIDLAENGLLGVRAVEDSQDPYDLILMDVQMPVMNGYDATRAIRAGGFVGPIVALTAHAMATDRSRCLASGCDEYETKPITRARFLAKIASLVKSARQLSTS
jgi:signal transduction histidine kinase